MPTKRFSIMFGTGVTSDEKEFVRHNLTETIQSVFKMLDHCFLTTKTAIPVPCNGFNFRFLYLPLHKKLCLTCALSVPKLCLARAYTDKLNTFTGIRYAHYRNQLCQICPRPARSYHSTSGFTCQFFQCYLISLVSCEVFVKLLSLKVSYVFVLLLIISFFVLVLIVRFSFAVPFIASF